jgi:hypothetical protein
MSRTRQSVPAASFDSVHAIGALLGLIHHLLLLPPCKRRVQSARWGALKKMRSEQSASDSGDLRAGPRRAAKPFPGACSESSASGAVGTMPGVPNLATVHPGVLSHGVHRFDVGHTGLTAKTNFGSLGKANKNPAAKRGDVGTMRKSRNSSGQPEAALTHLLRLEASPTGLRVRARLPRWQRNSNCRRCGEPCAWLHED